MQNVLYSDNRIEIPDRPKYVLVKRKAIISNNYKNVRMNQQTRTKRNVI